MSKFVDIKYGHGLEHTVNAYKSPIAECLDFEKGVFFFSFFFLQGFWAGL